MRFLLKEIMSYRVNPLKINIIILQFIHLPPTPTHQILLTSDWTDVMSRWENNVIKYIIILALWSKRSAWFTFTKQSNAPILGFKTEYNAGKITGNYGLEFPGCSVPRQWSCCVYRRKVWRYNIFNVENNSTVFLHAWIKSLFSLLSLNILNFSANFWLSQSTVLFLV